MKNSNSAYTTPEPKGYEEKIDLDESTNNNNSNWVVIVDEEEQEIVVPAAVETPVDLNDTCISSDSKPLTGTSTDGHLAVNTTGNTISRGRNHTNAGGTGLSELSKQLRILQAKNQSQVLDIERLQRQLRILADLQNVNVNDIKHALEKACEAEAFGELQRRMAVLRTELEVVALANTVSSGTQSKQAATSVSTKLQEDMNYKKIIANLELRIGELEEIDEQHRSEIDKLYNQLNDHQSMNSSLHALCDQLKLENDQLKLLQSQQEAKILKEEDNDEQRNKNTSREAMGSAIRESNDALLVSKNMEIQKLQEENVRAMAQVREAETLSNVVSSKFKLCEQQRDSIENELNLRNAQYKARFIVQEENIEDLRQQLVSLYAAFELLREEKDKDDATMAALQSLLGHADAEVARQVDEIDQSNRSFISSSSSIGTSSPSMYKSPLSLSQQKQQRNSLYMVSESPITTPQYTSSSLNPGNRKNDAPIMAGDLLIKDMKGVMKKWRKRHVRLYATVSYFHLDVSGDDKGYAIQIGISKIELYSKYPYGFNIYFGDRSGMTMTCAALNDSDFQDWMRVLLYATTGAEINSSETLPLSPTTTTTTTITDRNDINNDPYQDSDYELALELSKRDLDYSQKDFV